MMTEKTSKHIDAAAASPSEPAAEKKLTPLRHAGFSPAAPPGPPGNSPLRLQRTAQDAAPGQHRRLRGTPGSGEILPAAGRIFLL